MQEYYWEADGRSRPPIKLWKGLSGQWLWEIRTWMSCIFGFAAQPDDPSDATSISRLHDYVKDRTAGWRQEMANIYPNKPLETLNCSDVVFGRKVRGLGGTTEWTCSSHLLMSMLVWSIRAKRRPAEAVQISIPLFRSVIAAVFEKHPGVLIRFQFGA